MEPPLPLSLYFHIPFCTTKCPYCHFYVVPNRKMYHDLLFKAFVDHFALLKSEMRGRPTASIYFGGGTPSLFTRFEELFQSIDLDTSQEITLEVNPEEASLDLFSKLRSLGINRLSIGVQSLEDSSLQILGRNHSSKKAIEAIVDAEKAGFKNISIDLMYDVPSQTKESWISTLHQIQDLPIQHISLYNLTVEPHTVFYKKQVKLPDSEDSLFFLMKALETFEQLGFRRYELSAFAKKGYESVHNLGYWTAREFLGLGPSAFSYFQKRRFQNVCNIHRYARSLKEGKLPTSFEEKLSFPSDIKELFAIHLRVQEGVCLDQFPYPDREILNRLIDQNLLKQTNRKIQLTDQGMLFYDTVASEIIDLPQPQSPSRRI